MERLTHGRTTFLITHRMTALKHCDLILKIDDGRVAALESGPTRAVEEATPSRRNAYV